MNGRGRRHADDPSRSNAAGLFVISLSLSLSLSLTFQVFDLEGAIMAFGLGCRSSPRVDLEFDIMMGFVSCFDVVAVRSSLFIQGV
jgi:hypothetical protein